MNQVGILSIAEGAARWNSALASFGEVDIYARHGYVQASAGDAALLAVVRTAAGELAIPLVPQSLPGGEGYDAESPYGYPGVMTRGDVSACWPVLIGALRERGIINLFLRLHPFSDHTACAHLLLGAPHATAWIPLTEGREQAFAGGSCASHRTKVNRSRRLGFTTAITVAPSTADLTSFRILYDQTMERLSATTAYRFDDRYYAQIAAGLGDDLALVTVGDPDGRPFAQALMLCGPRYGHYHLSGRREADNAAGNLLFEAMADHAAARGLAGVHLGGGMSDSPDDSLLQFKQRLARGRSEYRVAGLICNLDRHQSLVDDWRRRSGRQSVWFQAYRQPIPMESSL